MKVEKYKNRYGSEFIFTPLEDGNVLWEGDFKYCRYGFPNDYSKAYAKYLEDQGGEPYSDHTWSISQFEVAVHEYVENEATDFSKKYRELVESNRSIINMVEPSGGPYMTSGMKQSGRLIERFEPVEKGYLIVCEK